ncbi:ROK family protein [Acetobacteraceae bacterium H6797]|nr:ROK family protein [Acetobacteraceae bacterium H6797]
MIKIGVDLGGTKTEVVALDEAGQVLLRRRAPTPYTDYGAIIETIGTLVEGVEAELSRKGTVGVGIPGSLSPATGLVRNANSQVLNGHPLDKDIAARLGRAVRLTNDANCLAMSEAADGAAAGHGTVFAVIIGTGTGAGVVVNGRILDGFNRVGGEFGHNPLPWMTAEEYPGPLCWCGLHGCQELFLSGPALAADWKGKGHRHCDGIVEAAASGDATAQSALDRYADRLARALAGVVNLIDPDVIVLGGGLSNLPLYDRVPRLIGRHVFGDVCRTPVVQAKHGDSSGVFGAARLWDGE